MNAYQYPYNYQYPCYYPSNQPLAGLPQHPLPYQSQQLYQILLQQQSSPQQASPQYRDVPSAAAIPIPAQHQLQSLQQRQLHQIGGAYNPQMQLPFQVPFYYYNNINEKKTKLSTTWTQREDKLLRELKEKQKLGWRDISTFFNDRTPNACQFRWRRIISSINGVGATGGVEASTSSGKNSRSSSVSSTSSTSSTSSMSSPNQSRPVHSHSSSISSASSSPKINKKSHHSINYILN